MSIALVGAGAILVPPGPYAPVASAEAAAEDNLPRVEASGSLPVPKWVPLLSWGQPQSQRGRTIHARVSPADPNQAVTFYAGLARPESKAQKIALAAATPGSGSYRHHWSARKIRRQLGVGAATMKSLRSALTGTGVGAVLDGTGVFARLSGSAQSLANLLGSPIVEVATPTLTAFGLSSDPVLPGNLQGVIAELVPFYAVQATATAVTSSRHTARTTTSPSNTGTPARVCKSLRDASGGTQMLQEAQSFQQGAVAYGAAGLQRRVATRGDARGFDPRVGIISMGEGYSQTAAEVSAQCFQWSTGSYRNVLTDGMSQPLAEGVEGDLDVQMAGAIMARSSRMDYFATLPFQPIAQVLPVAAAFNAKSRPDVLSVSYGICESVLMAFGGAGAISIANSIYLRLGLAGTSVLVSSGDTGSAGCMRFDASPAQAVQFPSTSPWVTAVGGTRMVLTAKNHRRGEVVWNDSDFVGGALDTTNNSGAGGGGASTLFGRPGWQRKSVTHVAGRRAVPDLAAHSSGAPAWIVMIGGEPAPVWGTSSATPLVAGSVALLNAHEKLAGHATLGFLNPWLYSIRAPRNSAFFDIVSGSNDLTGNGCCAAARGYDQATGLGAPNFGVMRRRITPAG